MFKEQLSAQVLVYVKHVKFISLSCTVNIIPISEGAPRVLSRNTGSTSRSSPSAYPSDHAVIPSPAFARIQIQFEAQCILPQSTVCQKGFLKAIPKVCDTVAKCLYLIAGTFEVDAEKLSFVGTGHEGLDAAKIVGVQFIPITVCFNRVVELR